MYFYHPNTRAASLLIGLLLDPPQRVAGIKDKTRPARKETSIIKGYPLSGMNLKCRPSSCPIFFQSYCNDTLIVGSLLAGIELGARGGQVDY